MCKGYNGLKKKKKVKCKLLVLSLPMKIVKQKNSLSAEIAEIRITIKDLKDEGDHSSTSTFNLPIWPYRKQMDFVESRCCTRCDFIAGVNQHIPRHLAHSYWSGKLLWFFFSICVSREHLSSLPPAGTLLAYPRAIDSPAHCHDLVHRDPTCLPIPQNAMLSITCWVKNKQYLLYKPWWDTYVLEGGERVLQNFKGPPYLYIF